MKLLVSAILKFSLGLFFVGALLFLPAGTFAFFNAWLFMALLFVPILVLGIVLFIKAPTLLEKRLNAKEKQGAQKGVVAASALLFIGGFIEPLRYRLEVRSLILIWVVEPTVVLLMILGLISLVMKQKRFILTYRNRHIRSTRHRSDWRCDYEQTENVWHENRLCSQCQG